MCVCVSVYGGVNNIMNGEIIILCVKPLATRARRIAKIALNRIVCEQKDATRISPGGASLPGNDFSITIMGLALGRCYTRRRREMQFLIASPGVRAK